MGRFCVHWILKKGGITSTVVVQVKDWKGPVKQATLLEFRSVLEDIPGQPRGVLVTKTGYQGGAKKYASAHGIYLYELSEVPGPPPITLTDIGSGYFKLVKDFPHKRFIMDFVAFDPEITELKVGIDSTWFADIEARFGSTTGASVRATRMEGVPRDVHLYDENGMAKFTLRDVFAEFSQQMWSGKLLLNYRAKKTFNEPTFFRSQLPLVPFIKIRDISTTLELYPKLYQDAAIPEFVEFMLKDVLTGDTNLVRLPRRKN